MDNKKFIILMLFIWTYVTWTRDKSMHIFFRVTRDYFGFIRDYLYYLIIVIGPTKTFSNGEYETTSEFGSRDSRVQSHKFIFFFDFAFAISKRKTWTNTSFSAQFNSYYPLRLRFFSPWAYLISFLFWLKYISFLSSTSNSWY